MGIFAKTKLEFLPDNCRACPLSDQMVHVVAKCRILQKYMPDGNNCRPTGCPLKARTEGVFIDCTAMDKLPGGCEECKMGNRYGCVGDVKCHILNDYFTGNVKPPYKERPDECPLIEAPNGKKSSDNFLPLDELMKLDCEYSPSSIQPVFIHLKESSWGGTCGANVGYASVKFDTEAGTAEVWLVGWDIPATVEISEYGKSWVSYLHKPDFMRTNL